MRGGLSGGEATTTTAPGPRRRAGREHLEACACCRRLFDVATMLAWSDGTWCVACATAALVLERNGDELTLRRELRQLQQQTDAARRREAAERAGENTVRVSSEGE